jgi:N12 class adenine-specific DNA methylase
LRSFPGAFVLGTQSGAVADQPREDLRFRSWVFSAPDRTERLVRLYDDTYNNPGPYPENGVEAR